MKNAIIPGALCVIKHIHRNIYFRSRPSLKDVPYANEWGAYVKTANPLLIIAMLDCQNDDPDSPYDIFALDSNGTPWLASI
jgi:hypothetical protein